MTGKSEAAAVLEKMLQEPAERFVGEKSLEECENEALARLTETIEAYDGFPVVGATGETIGDDDNE